MAEQTGINMEKQSSEYLRMSELLKKERPPEAIGLVRKVLDSGVSLEEKIRRIEAIDAQDIFSDLERSGISDDEAKRIIRQSNLYTRETAEKNIDQIKLKSFRTPYLLFVLRDFLKIRDFGKRTKVLSSVFFPPSVSANFAEFPVFFARLKKDADELLPVLKFVLEKGWLHLDKMEYNLVAVFNILCEIIHGYKVPQGKKEAPFLLEKMKNIESYFLACRYQDGYPALIQSGIRTVLQKQNRHRSHIELSQFLTRRILMEDRTGYCLHNLVLGMNMAKLRKFLRLEDLIRSGQGGVINTFDYDCPQKIRERIGVYINDQLQIWKTLNGERNELEKINYFLKAYSRTGEDGYRSYDYRLLEEYYEFKRGGEQQFRFSRDRENAAHTAVNLFGMYLHDFENLFTGSVKLETWGDCRIFRQDFFQFELDQLRLFSRKLAESVYTCPFLAFDEFREYKSSERKKSPSPPQLVLMQNIDALADTVANIGRKTGSVCQRRNRGAFWAGEMKEPPPPLEISVLRLPEITSPLFQKKILGEGYLKDKSVIDSLAEITGISLLSGLFFLNPRLYAMLDREIRINDGIREARKNLERIADAVTYEKIRKLAEITGAD